MTTLTPQRFPDGVKIHGTAHVVIHEPASICEPADINGTDSSIVIGEGADIAAFVTINCADSHLRCLGISEEIERKPIVIEDHVFVGQGAIILGGTHIGHHSVIGAGVVLKGEHIPPYSRITSPSPFIQPGFYSRPRR